MTNERRTIETLSNTLRKHGFCSRIVPVRRLQEVKQQITTYHERGFFDDEFFLERVTMFDFAPPADLPNARSVILVSAPQPQVRMKFTWKGRQVALTVPPTYSDGIDQRIQALVANVLVRRGYRFVSASVPKKALAVHSGLGEYGRNNIVYIPGLGSFHRLVAFFSELTCQDGRWRALRLAEYCKDCRACIHTCPTGAIDRERFLLRAERCISFRNEKPPEVSFPTWIDPSWHNCLIGCMQCQRFCPLNRAVIEWSEDGAAFTEDETGLFLSGATLGQLPETTMKKLEQCGLRELLEVFPRNLQVALEAS